MRNFWKKFNRHGSPNPRAPASAEDPASTAAAADHGILARSASADVVDLGQDSQDPSHPALMELSQQQYASNNNNNNRFPEKSSLLPASISGNGGGSSNRHGKGKDVGLEPLVIPMTEAITRLTAVAILEDDRRRHQQIESASKSGLDNSRHQGSSNLQGDVNGEPLSSIPGPSLASHQDYQQRPLADSPQAAAFGTLEASGRRDKLGSRHGGRDDADDSLSPLTPGEGGRTPRLIGTGKSAAAEDGSTGDGVFGGGAGGPSSRGGSDVRGGSENARSRSLAADPRKGDLLSLATFYKEVKTKTMGDISVNGPAGTAGIPGDFHLLARPGSFLQRRRSEEDVNHFLGPLHMGSMIRNPPPTPVVNSSSGSSANNGLSVNGGGPAGAAVISLTAPATAVGGAKPWKLEPLTTAGGGGDRHRQLQHADSSFTTTDADNDGCADEREGAGRRHQHVERLNSNSLMPMMTAAARGNKRLTAAVSNGGGGGLGNDCDPLFAEDPLLASPLPAPRGLHLSVNFTNATGRRLAKLEPPAGSLSNEAVLLPAVDKQMFRAKTLPGINKSSGGNAGGATVMMPPTAADGQQEMDLHKLKKL